MPKLSASHRLRIGRYDEPNRLYLLTANTLHREPVFRDFALGKLVGDQFRNAEELGFADSLAWVVMPDHFHWLIDLKQGSLSELMQRTKSLSARAVNTAAGRKGTLWQHGFHDRALRREDDLVQMARYVVANPLRAGLVQRFSDYPLWHAIWADGQTESLHSRAGSLPQENAFQMWERACSRSGSPDLTDPAHTPSTPTG